MNMTHPLVFARRTVLAAGAFVLGGCAAARRLSVVVRRLAAVCYSISARFTSSCRLRR
jgi:hypothetical protein